MFRQGEVRGHKDTKEVRLLADDLVVEGGAIVFQIRIERSRSDHFLQVPKRAEFEHFQVLCELQSEVLLTEYVQKDVARSVVPGRVCEHADILRCHLFDIDCDLDWVLSVPVDENSEVDLNHVVNLEHREHVLVYFVVVEDL